MINERANIYRKCLIIIFGSFIGSLTLLNSRDSFAENIIGGFETHSSITTIKDDFKVNVKVTFKLGTFKDIRNVIAKL